MEISREGIRLLLLHEFRLGHSATKAVHNISATMGDDALSYDTAKRWFKRFKNGNFDLSDQPHPGRRSSVDDDLLLLLIEEEPRSSLDELADRLECSRSTVEIHLHRLGKSWRYGRWNPHELNSDLRRRRIDVCMELVSAHRNYEWLSNIVTGDEKWVLYVNHNRKRQWLGSGETGVPEPKPDLHPKKIMLSIWWSARGVVHWELLPTGTSITATVYCEQLERVASNLHGKQDRVYFLHDNARPHVANVTRQKLLSFGWVILPHPPYSPDLAPTDYHLFRSLSNHLKSKKYDDEDHLKGDLSTFFNKKKAKFYADGINSLPIRWQHVIDNEGAYYED